MILYPQLPRTLEVESLARELSRIGIELCRRRRATSHHLAVMSPTGGIPATSKHLLSLADKLTATAERHGYPSTRKDTRIADITMAEVLFDTMEITPSEASLPGVWHFITCVLVPDLTSWRFPAQANDAIDDSSLNDFNIDRWVTKRHSGRNCFGRLWWRACILREGNTEKPYKLMSQLKEDEFVQIMERPMLAGYANLMRETARMILETEQIHPKIHRSNLLREVQKRLLRLGAVLEFHALSPSDLKAMLDGVFSQSLKCDNVLGRKIKTKKN